MTAYAPCPFCGGTQAERVKFTWWGGLLGPKILSHVKCISCGKGYNGKTGTDNTNKIVVYAIVVGLVCLGIVVVVFAALGIFMMAAR